MKTSDKLISAITLGLLAPIVLALLFWWGAYIIDKRPDTGFIFLIAAGLTAGMILNATVLRKFIFSLFMLPFAGLITIEVFYSVMIYGFFMGFPVFNSLVGVAGSYIVIRKSVINNNTADKRNLSFKKISLFSFFLLLFLCLCSAVLALGEPSICLQVQSMLGLKFSVEMWMIWLLIIAGGAALLIFQYAASRLVIKAEVKSLREAR